MSNRKHKLFIKRRKELREKKYEPPYHWPTDEEFEKELAVSNYLMIKRAKELGLSDEDCKSPSKCYVTVMNHIADIFFKGFNKGVKEAEKMNIKKFNSEGENVND